MSDKQQPTTHGNGSVYEEGSLKIHRLTPGQVIFTVVGCGIGSGCLGTAYSARLSGLPVLLFWFLVTGIMTLFSMLYVAESALRTKRMMQLPGLAERYVGKSGAVLIFIAVAINSIGCMCAYFSGSGSVLNALLGIPNWMGTIFFLIPAVGIGWFGLKAIGAGNQVISVGMIILLFTLTVASFLSKNGEVQRIFNSNWSYAVPVFNVAAFSYIGQYLVPDLARGLSHAPRKLAPSVAVGQLLVFLMLCMVPIGVFYITKTEEITQVATIAWGRSLGSIALYTANIFSLCAMLTSYWPISNTLLTSTVDIMKLKSDADVKTRLPLTIIIVGIPLVLVLSGMVGFVDAVYFAGIFAGSIMAILPIFMLRGARKKGEIEPEWTCGWMAHPVIQGIIIFLYIATMIYAIFGAFGFLPKGW